MSSNYKCERFTEGKNRGGGRKRKEKRAERTEKEQSVRRERRGGEDEKFRYSRLTWTAAISTHHTHTHLKSMIVKKLCYYYKNLLSLSDGFLICFTRGFQSQFWLEAKRTGQKASARASLSEGKKIYTFNSTFVISQRSFIFSGILVRKAKRLCEWQKKNKQKNVALK